MPDDDKLLLNTGMTASHSKGVGCKISGIITTVGSGSTCIYYIQTTRIFCRVRLYYTDKTSSTICKHMKSAHLESQSCALQNHTWQSKENTINASVSLMIIASNINFSNYFEMPSKSLYILYFCFSYQLQDWKLNHWPSNSVPSLVYEGTPLWEEQKLVFFLWLLPSASLIFRRSSRKAKELGGQDLGSPPSLTCVMDASKSYFLCMVFMWHVCDRTKCGHHWKYI